MSAPSSPAFINPSEEPLPTAPEVLIACLEKLGISHEVHRHQAVFTVAESQSIDAQIPGAHTRNMFLKDKKGVMFLVTLMHETPIDLKKLSEVLESGRFSFGSPERLWTHLGVRPGSVTPFAIINDTAHEVQLVLEEKMMQQERVNFHPLINTMTVGLSPADLLRFMGSIGVTPRIVNLDTAAPDQA